MYHFSQPKFLFHYRWVTHVEDDIVIIYVLTNNGVCFTQGLVASVSYVVRTCIDIVIKITLIHNGKAEFIGDHSMGPEIFICCWDISIEFEKWISYLGERRAKLNVR